MGQFARKFLANYTILVTGDLAAKILLMWASVRIAHVLGADLFGDLAFAAAFTAYFALLVSQGLGNYGMQEIARHPERIGEYAGTILAMRLAASLAAAIVLGAAVWLMDRPAGLKILLLLYGLLFFSAAATLSWVYQAMEQMKWVAIAGVLSQLVFSICVLIFLRAPSQFAWVPIFQFAGEALQALFLLVYYRRKFGSLRLAFDLPAWIEIWKNSIPIGLSLALSMVLYNFDVVLLGFMRPAADVGQYSAAYRFINFFVAFLALYTTNIFPAVSRCRENPELLTRISDRSLKYTLALAIPLAAGGTFVARPLMLLMFGHDFVPGAPALSILFWVIPIMVSRAVYRATLLSHGLQKDFLWIALAAAVLNTGLNLAFIPAYGYMATAVTSVLGELLILILVYDRVARKITKLALGPHLWRPAFACLPMVAFLIWTADSGLPVRIGGGMVIYGLSALAIGVVHPGKIWKEIHPT